jgi:peptidoglycan hydrolase CwlO-like protein
MEVPMDILGAIGNLYTFILLVILFLGSGLAVWSGINAIIRKKDELKENTSQIKENLNSKLQKVKNYNYIGGIRMKNSGFIKLAVFSFVGIIISAAILTALPNYSGTMNNMNMNSQYNTTSMNMSGMNSMPGMSNYSFQGTMNSNSDLTYIQQQLNSMQQQINQMQNQMNSMNSGSSMNNNSNTSSNSNSNSSSSMSSMPMM